MHIEKHIMKRKEAVQTEKWHLQQVYGKEISVGKRWDHLTQGRKENKKFINQWLNQKTRIAILDENSISWLVVKSLLH